MVRFDSAAAAHLLRRAGFGADGARVARAVRDGLDATLEELFAAREHEPLYRRGVEAVLAGGEIEPLAGWWMALVLRDRAPLVERVALMWHDHFATSWDKVRDTRLMHAQVELFRDRGLGDFRALLRAVAQDPAMLLWLDGNENKKGHPNENFAREVLELFGLGIGHYTEHDVQEAARAFSGQGVDGRRFVFRAQHHDEAEKEIFGRRGNFDGPAVIDLILDHPACARHVASRLLTEFVAPAPDDAMVTEWSRVLVAEEWSVERTLARLFRSELFFSPAARRARIAGPVELVAITCRALDLAPAPTSAARAAAEMGQALYRPPSVKGWDGGRSWIHAGSWLARHNHLAAAVEGADADRLLRALGKPQDAESLARALAGRLFPDGADAALLDACVRAARAGGGREDGLRRATSLALTAPEYHLV